MTNNFMELELLATINFATTAQRDVREYDSLFLTDRKSHVFIKRKRLLADKAKRKTKKEER